MEGNKGTLWFFCPVGLCCARIKNHIAFLSAFVLLLSACGGGDEGGVVCDTDYRDETLSTCLPADWEAIDRETLLQRGVPEETIAAFQSSQSYSGQFPTVAVTKEVLGSAVEPEQYSEASIRSVQVINGYEHVDTRNFTVAGTETSLHVFTGQPIEGEPRRRFYQASITEENVGYTVTGVAPVSVSRDLEAMLLLIIGEVSFDAPDEKEEGEEK